MVKKKPVHDALRKLEIKGIVERRNGKFILTSRGKSIYSSLKEIIVGGTQKLMRSSYYARTIDLRPLHRFAKCYLHVEGIKDLR